MITGEKGMTVMEILMVLIVAAILAALATPWILGTIQSYRVRTAAWEVAGDLRLARQKAVSTQVRHRLCVANCDTPPPTGGYVLEREGTPWTLDLVRDDFPNGVAITSSADKVTYGVRGEASAAAITLSNNIGTYQVVASPSGRVRVCKGSCPP
jgi:prepilin-type N-terminal cleavage/methylation domain-containing protein